MDDVLIWKTFFCLNENARARETVNRNLTNRSIKLCVFRTASLDQGSDWRTCVAVVSEIFRRVPIRKNIKLDSKH
jgi:hypothetical protein